MEKTVLTKKQIDKKTVDAELIDREEIFDEIPDENIEQIPGPIETPKPEKASVNSEVQARIRDNRKSIYGKELGSINTSAKEALNYTVKSDGSFTESSISKMRNINNRIDAAQKNIENKIVNRLAKSGKFKLDEEINAFVGDKNWKKKFLKMGATERETFGAKFSDTQKEYIKSLNLELDNIGRWSEKDMERVVNGLASREDIRSVVKKGLDSKFDAQLAKFNDLSRIRKEYGQIAKNTSQKMSGYKTLGRMALGGALMVGLVSALSDNKGQQSNAQLYGQQPLY